MSPVGGEEPAPCSVCGSRVRVRQYPGDPALSQPRNEVYEKRTCTNPDCDTNGPERALNQTP